MLPVADKAYRQDYVKTFVAPSSLDFTKTSPHDCIVTKTNTLQAGLYSFFLTLKEIEAFYGFLKLYLLWTLKLSCLVGKLALTWGLFTG